MKNIIEINFNDKIGIFCICLKLSDTYTIFAHKEVGKQWCESTVKKWKCDFLPSVAHGVSWNNKSNHLKMFLTKLGAAFDLLCLDTNISSDIFTRRPNFSFLEHPSICLELSKPIFVYRQRSDLFYRNSSFIVMVIQLPLKK